MAGITARHIEGEQVRIQVAQAASGRNQRSAVSVLVELEQAHPSCSSGNIPHHRVQRVLRLETDAGAVGKLEVTVFNFRVIRETGEDAEYAGLSRSRSNDRQRQAATRSVRRCI